MYPNLKAEMARFGITNRIIAEKTGHTNNYVSRKMRGDEDMSLRFAKIIKSIVNPNMPLDELFEETDGNFNNHRPNGTSEM